MNNDRRAEIMSALPILAQASALIVQARDVVDGAKDEEQSYLDEMPEGFKNGEKGSVAQEAIDSLESVDFDGIFGDARSYIEQASA